MAIRDYLAQAREAKGQPTNMVAKALNQLNLLKGELVALGEEGDICVVSGWRKKPLNETALAWLSWDFRRSFIITIEIFQAQDGDFRFDMKKDNKDIAQYINWSDVEKMIARFLA